MYHDLVVHAVVPAYNEAEHVGAVVRTMPALVDRIFIVDDSSTDGTARVAEDCADPRVTVLRTPRNLGVGGATVLGYRHALEAGAEIVVKMDGDGQMPPVYDGAPSHLSIFAVMSTFPLLLLRRFFHRVVQKYVIRDFSPIALFLFVGLASLTFGIVLGGTLWLHGISTGVPTPTGSIILVLLALVVGFQLCLQAIVLDIQATPR